MIPNSYNIKNEDLVNVCKACDWLCSAFRSALLEGDFDKAIALHATENINLTTPFANIKGEVFYPVHCAALGGNLSLLKWLLDDNCCPLRSIRVGRRNDLNNLYESYTPILTSSSRSLLNLALSKVHIGILRYLVVEKNMCLQSEMKYIPVETLAVNLDLILRMLPKETADRCLPNGKQVKIANDAESHFQDIEELEPAVEHTNAEDVCFFRSIA